MFGPWLDPAHHLFVAGSNPNPMYGQPSGKLLWVITDHDGKDLWVDGPEPVELHGRTYTPMSRTFIPAQLADNPYLAETGYAASLDGLQEPLRSAVRDGNWLISHKDDDWQVIPTAWIMAAQDRWDRDGWKGHQMTAMALDCAGGGRDAAAIAYRHGGWYGQIETVEGGQTADGAVMASTIMRHRRDGAALVLDVGGGYAGATIERCKDNSIPYRAFNGATKSIATARGTNMKFKNKRAEAIWKLREELDPEQEQGSPIALPPDPELLGELAAARWGVATDGSIKIEDKEKIRDRIGRSPNKADAVIMCLSEGNKEAIKRLQARAPKVILQYPKVRRGR
jgi:hypothetical protein